MLSYLRKKMKTIMIAVAVVFFASMFYGISQVNLGGGREYDKSLAKVNGKAVDPLRYQEILARLAAQFGGNLSPHDAPFLENLALSQAVDFTLVLKEARRQVKVSNSEVKMALTQMMQQGNIPSEKQLDQALKRNGISLGQFKGLLKDEMLVQKMVSKVRSDVKVNPEDMREVRASHILVTQEALAKSLLARAKKGEDFAALAKQYSIDSGSAVKGGDLGFFRTGAMVEPFEKAAFRLKVGEVSGLVKSSFGYHLIKVTDTKLRQAEKNQNLEQVVLTEKQQSAFQTWYSRIRQKANVEIVNPKFKAHQFRFSGRLREAIDEYRRAIAAEPRDPYLHINLGDVYATMGQKTEALAEYGAAVNLEAGNPLLYMIYAEELAKAGQKSEAIAQLSKASLVAGDNKAVHEKLRDEFKKLGASAEAGKEQAEIKRIEKKESFEKSLGVQVGPEEKAPAGR